MSGNKDLRRAKHEAYQKKQAAKGEKVIKWTSNPQPPS